MYQNYNCRSVFNNHYHTYGLHFSMPRKFRLYVRKRQYRRSQETLVVSIPLSDVSTRCTQQHHSPESMQESIGCTQQPLKLIVSLPVSHFSALPLTSLSELHTRMVQLMLLPSGWIDITSGADQLSLCHIVRPPAAGLPTVNFTLVIDTNLSWKLYFFKQRVEIDRCPTFATTSTTMKSPTDIMNVLSVIETSQVCVGNPDEKFLPLLKHRQGLLLNGDGNLLMVFYNYLRDMLWKFMEFAVYSTTQKSEVFSI